MVRYKNDRKTENNLIKQLVDLTDEKSMKEFLLELLTTQEYVNINRRWSTLIDLYKGTTQREIANSKKMSLEKISKGSSLLHNEKSLIRQILEREYGKPESIYNEKEE